MSASVVLLATGAAKILSGVGGAEVLDTFDPVTGFRFRSLFLGVGIIEFIIAATWLCGVSMTTQSALVASLGTGFLLYRLGLLLLGMHQPCGCLGTLTDGLGISAESADTGMKLVLGYLLMGGYLVLLSCLKKERDESGNGHLSRHHSRNATSK
jgi:hypothetical protein